MKFLQLLTLLFFSITLSAQTTADFENINLDSESFNNGSDLSGGFQSGNIFIPNVYTPDPNFPSWAGWSVSNMTDITTLGFTNQYSSFSSGANGGDNFAVANAFFPVNMILTGEAQGAVVNGISICNGTYAALSMLEGDGFAKKFGGESGNDEDYFLLTIRGFRDETLTADSVNFYLADYRFENNDEDYIVDEWTFVDLTSLGNVDSLNFSLSSTDVGGFGMNTPSYFLVDDVVTSDMSVSTTELSNLLYNTYPNPVQDRVFFDANIEQNSSYILYDESGTIQTKGRLNNRSIHVSALNAGMYYVVFESGSSRFIKM